ncbi:MAG: hypothetical protein KKE57_08170 [Proteobacteria bacterium]|nr:hypothetical protein [Pseudomonadota bacterium]
MTERTKGKVISINAWRDARSMEENLRMGISYQSLIGSIAEMKSEDDLHYFVVSYSIPGDEFADEDFFYEPEESELFTVIKDKGVGEFMPLEGGRTERYEFFDVNTGDIHVMYRIPYKPPIPKPVKDNPLA